MVIVSYDNKYEENLKNLLVELQEYIVSIDREEFNRAEEEFREKYFSKIMEDVNKYEGKIFLALENDIVVGAIIGVINNDEIDNYDFKAPKRGRVIDLVVANDYQGMGIGKKLLQSMENHFKDVGCRGVLLDVFAYNDKAYKFYEKYGYFNRTIQMMKNI